MSAGGRRSLVQRLSVGVVDQIVSSGANFLAMVMAARALSTSDFGAFALVMLTYNVAIGIVRALCSEAILVRPGEVAGGPARALAVRRRRGGASNTGLMIGSAVMLGLVAVPLLGIAGALASGGLRQSLWVLAVAIPGLLLQDALRFVAFAQRRPADALLSDVAWLIGMVATFGLLTFVEDPSAAHVIACWSAPSLIGALVVLPRLDVDPYPEPKLLWVRRNRDLSLRYLLDYLSGQGSGQLAVYSVAVVSGVAAVASIRGSQTLFGAVAVLQTGAMAVLVPEGSRMAETSARSVLKMALVAAGAFFAVGVAATLVFTWMPDRAGVAVLGETWDVAQDTLLPIGLAAAASGVVAGAAIGLRALSAAKVILRVRIFTTPVQIVLPICGAVLADEVGAAYGLVAAAGWTALWYWKATVDHVGERERERLAGSIS